MDSLGSPLGGSFVDRVAEGLLELMRLEEGMGDYWGQPEVLPPGVTEHMRDKLARRAESTRAGALHEVPMLTQMRKRGQIDRIEERAGLMLATDFVGAYRVSGLVSGIYAKADRPRGMRLPSERMSPEEARTFHYGRLQDACRAIGHRPTLEACLLLVCEYAPSSAAEVGERFLPYKQQQQRQAVGVTLVKVGLQKLAQFYGLST